MKLSFVPITRRAIFPVVCLVFLGLIVGLLTLDDYGESWDENLLYSYADDSLSAYNIWDWWEGDVVLQDHYGPTNHRFYGPAYLLIARLFVGGLGKLPVGWQVIDLWHLVNFLTFLSGILLVYALCRRFVEPKPAFGSAFLFASQPLLWGHGFMNPKDIPFMVFFLAAVIAGFRMVDALVQQSGRLLPEFSDGHTVSSHLRANWFLPRSHLQKGFAALAGLLSLLAIPGCIARDPMDVWTSRLVQRAYSEPGNWAGKLLRMVSENINTVGVEAYTHKALLLLHRFQLLIILVSLAVILAAIGLWFPKLTQWIWAKRIVPMARSAALRWFLLAGVLLGLCTSIRLVGPAAGFMVAIYLLARLRQHAWRGLGLYGFVALSVMFGTWPFLWGAPLAHFGEALAEMAAFPFLHDVLFAGKYYKSYDLPRSYFPVLIGIKLTLPVVLLALSGLGLGVFRLRRRGWQQLTWVLVIAWFLLPFLGVLLFQPPMYDNFRQFLFVLPPLFVLVAQALDALLARLRIFSVQWALLMVLALPGLIWGIFLHPYQYTYYNYLVGGVGGAFRRYETDYWATAYREAVEYINTMAPFGERVVVSDPPHIAWRFARQDLWVEEYSEGVLGADDVEFAIVTTRFDNDFYQYPDAEAIYRIERAGAIFAEVRRVR